MTIAELLRQATDAKTMEAARRLFFSRRWQLLQGDGNWLWGEFQLNGPAPLRAAVDLLNGRFCCNCRSRQQPCAHALSLVMILNNQAERITVAEMPDWVAAHQNQTVVPNSQAVDASTTTSSSLIPDAKRLQLMQQGMQELELRLIDIVERGLADTNSLGPDFWADTATRLTDAKLSGLASQVRWMSSKNLAASQQLNLLASLYLAVLAWRNSAQLPEPALLELLRYLGVAVKKEQLLQQKSLADYWLVMGVVEGEEDRLRYRRVWLRGEKSKRYALLLDYAFGEQPFERGWALSSAWQGNLHYYPGNYPQRAILPFPSPGQHPYDGLKGYENFAALRSNYQKALAQQPWLQQYPAYLQALQPLSEDGHFFLVDALGEALAVEPDLAGFYTLLAASYGETLAIFAEFDGYYLRPLSYVSETGLRAI